MVIGGWILSAAAALFMQLPMDQQRDVDSLHATADKSPTELRSEAFVAAQYAMFSTAASAVDRVTARFASGGGKIGELERERDALVSQLEAVERELTSLSRSSGPAGEDLAKVTARRQGLRTQLDALDQRISSTFPQYFELTRPQPLSIGDAQRLLNRDEALLLALVAEDATYLWAVSAEDAAWVRVETLKADLLRQKVTTIRSSMNVAGARGSIPQETTRAAGQTLGSSVAAPRGEFDTATAHELYRELIQPLESVLAGKSVLLTNVSGPLTSLPLSLLVTAPPAAAGDLSQVSWLADRFALAELPSVSSLRALRCLLIARKADAHAGCDRVAESSAHGRAAGRQLKLAGYGAPVLAGKLPDGSAAPPAPADVMVGQTAIPAKLRQLSDLPQAQAELQTLAQQFGRQAVIVIGADATEQAVKSSSAIPRAQFVVFSTHGLLATEIGENAEPGLVFTPPSVAAGDNDGLLTASEAAQLRLSADLVVLSACNTAAPDGKPGAEGLSGLTRAFLFAGARSMLVSHWAVSDDATAQLMQQTFTELEKADFRGRAVALQKAMQVLRDSQGGRYRDPRFWAPFTLVGEPVS